LFGILNYRLKICSVNPAVVTNNFSHKGTQSYTNYGDRYFISTDKPFGTALGLGNRETGDTGRFLGVKGAAARAYTNQQDKTGFFSIRQRLSYLKFQAPTKKVFNCRMSY
jgi:hypothetical protein